MSITKDLKRSAAQAPAAIDRCAAPTMLGLGVVAAYAAANGQRQGTSRK